MSERVQKEQWIASELVDEIWPNFEQFGDDNHTVDDIFDAWKPLAEEVTQNQENDFTIVKNWWLPQSEKKAKKIIENLFEESVYDDE